MSQQQTGYTVNGMKCHGCEAGAKKSVEQLPGCVDANFDFKTASGVVTGEVDPQAVIKALSGCGYPASLKES
ncbi:MAG: heavy-metal-associated domain-containing protein [Gammaproteobacteria bacterium]|nr:heavy-metal-associated domain-containing protein [Gammaproteobacteria bacterium]